jgi:hypothetical protein
MYKNLRDLFKSKYIDDSRQNQGTDRSQLGKKSSYQTYMEMKHKLYNNKGVLSSRPTSIQKDR